MISYSLYLTKLSRFYIINREKAVKIISLFAIRMLKLESLMITDKFKGKKGDRGGRVALEKEIHPY